ncbi:MAG: tripartite tricarboxylate transporter substrate-binding protein [Alphaproteobacteria bacterium]|nr:tripartite tricarboxylate transporter substrate-binding protein [Alphaproteobacteria bacterium]
MYPSLTRRHFAAMAAMLAAPAVHAQAGFPNRPVRLIVAFGAGGNSDTMARLIQPRMAAFLGQPVVVENRGGAGGTLAAGQVAQAPADGHTLLFDAVSFVIAQFIHRGTPFDYERDFAPIGMVAEAPYVVATSAASGIRDFAGVMAAARRDSLAYGSPGIGTPGHLTGVLLAHQAGLRLEHVPYRGGAEVARDIAAGTLPVGILTVNSIKPVVDAGRAVAVAITSARRGGVDGVPTIAEQGFPGFDQTSWNGIVCRSGTPEPIRRRLEATVDAATADPEVRARLQQMGAQAVPADMDGFTARLARERDAIGRMIRETGITFG